MNDPSFFGDVHAAYGHIPLSIGVNHPIALEPCQEKPAKGSDEFKVLKSRIPTVHQYILRLKASLLGFQKHLLKVLVLGLLGNGLVINPKVAGDEGFPIRPEQGQKGNALHHPLVLATPMIGHQLHLLGVGLV